MIGDKLSEAGFELVNSGLRKLWAPDSEALQQCATFGKDFVDQIGQVQ